MLSRRDLVGRIAAGAAVIYAAGTAHASVVRRPAAGDVPPNEVAGAGSSPGPSGQSGPVGSVAGAGAPDTALVQAPWELLAPLALGSTVAHGWRIAGLTGAVDGTCVLTVENDRGLASRIHLCRNAGSPQGVVYTDAFDLVVMNGGAGDLPTDEGLAQAVANVAHVLSANESRHRSTVIASLMPHEERMRRFAGSDAHLR